MNNDLISRSALKEVIKDIVDQEIKEDRTWAIGLRHSLKIIDNAPTVELDEGVIQEVLNKRCMTVVANEYLVALHGTRPQGEWIPVSERLPEQNGVYITTCRDICEDRVHAVVFDGVRKKWGRGGVIAWQPLPEPYKKEGEEE